jgi:transcriptional regulator with XRE-family HTH domain
MNILLKETPISFGIILKDLLKEKGISQLTFANDLEMSPNTINAWITGKSKIKQNKELVLQKISEYFDVDVDYLALKQVEKKKQIFNAKLFNNSENLERISNEIKKNNIYLPYFKFLGIEVENTKSTSGKTYEYQTINDDKLQTYLIDEEEDNIIVTFRGETNTFDSKGFDEFLDYISDFVKFTTEKILQYT